MTGETVVDGAAFLGMHSADETIRSSCKDFFARRVRDEVWMSLEHVGWCDDVVWQHSRAVQDAYYPFMDTLHTEMAIRRVGYEERDVDVALTNPALTDLPMRERLLVGLVLRRDAVLYTANPRLRHRHDLPVVAVFATEEEPFPEHLEQLYQVSLALRLPFDAL
jgi:Family of unknown function (DUF6190)